MKIKSLVITIILLTSTIWSQAQQINAVPDYVFRNQMSVGRNAVTDTAAYFSIGPRYGATKGFMPPIVGDTATFSSGKRNGLLIFSVQKNKFLYWDSVRVQWSDMAGGSGSYILAGDTSAMLAPYLRKADTSSMLTPYIRHAGYGLTKSGQSFLVDTLNIATRAWRQKGLDSLAALEVSGSGTTNYVAKFTAGSTIGNSQIFDNGTNVGIGTASPSHKLDVTGAVRASADLYLGIASSSTARAYFFNSANTNRGEIYFDNSNNNFRIESTYGGSGTSQPISFWTGFAERLRIFANGRIGINTTTDAGYQLDVNGTLRSVNGANFATTSGNVGIGTASPLYKLQVENSANNFALSVKATSSNELQLSGNMTANDNSGTIRAVTSGGAAYAPLTLDASQVTTKISSVLSTFINTAGEFFINTTSDAGDYKLQVSGNALFTNAFLSANTGAFVFGTNSAVNPYIQGTSGNALAFGTSNNPRMQITADGEILINTSSDAGDYKLQVVGNARIGTGKLDIASNTTFGIGVARSGTSEVAGQIYNSNGILYLGAESSAGGQIFSGSSAYAAVIGSGAAYPLQFAANNITRATLTTNGNFMIGFPTDTYFYRLQVNGSIFSNNQIIAQNAAAQLNIDSSTNISPLYISNQSLTGSSAQGLFYGSTTWNTTGNPSLIDLAITNTASGSDANYIKISDGSNIFRVTKAAEVVTAAPTGGSIRKWKLGEAATVSPTSPNRTIRVEIDGTVYYLHAKTTND